MSAPIEDVDKEQNEVLLRIVTDAVVDPGTVMIHARNAMSARRAVMALRRLDRVALFALLRHHLVQEPHVPCVYNDPALLAGKRVPLLFLDLGIDPFHDRLESLLLFVLQTCFLY